MSFYPIYLHNWARFLVLGILPISVISLLNTKIYILVTSLFHTTFILKHIHTMYILLKCNFFQKKERRKEET